MLSKQRLLAVAAAVTLATPVIAQVPQLSVERIYGSRDFSPQQVRVNWMDDGRHYTVVEPDQNARTDLYKVDIRSGDRELLIRGTDLVPPGEDEPIAIDSYTFSADGSKLLIATGEQRIWRRSRSAFFYVWDFEARKLTPASTRPGPQRYAKLSPDGSRVAFVRGNNIYVTDLATGREKALTEDGGEDIINGATDWVYEEELSLADGFRWSPNGERIAFWRFDQSAIPPFYLINELALYPELTPVRYPKAGTDNSQVRLGVVDIASGTTRWIDVGPTDEEFYIARMDFADSSDEIWFRRLNRHQNRMDLYLADARTGRSQIIMTDADDAWIDIDTGDLIWIEDGEKFVYLSERDGYGQLLLFERDGTLVRKLTPGDWDVLGTHGVDERRDVVFFTGAADGPLVRPLYVVGLDGEAFMRISGATGTHRVAFDPTFTYYVDTYSEAGVPPVQTIRRANGQPVRTLTDNAELKRNLDALGLVRPEFMKVPVEGGVELNAWIIKPPDFDPSKKYPLLMYVYGGPGSQTVTDSWGGDRYLWHQLLAQRGYLVASVDNRGTGARGAAFKKITYLNLGKYESADQIAAARYFGGLSYVDVGRIGIWGWSYGGYMSSLSMFKGAGVFKTAIAVAPVTDWRLYDTIYTERYMRTPQENPDGYAQGAPQTYADRLQGHFLLVHGTGDDNVHPQNSYQLVQLLEDSNKQFEFRIYPNKAHGIAGPVSRVNLFGLMTEFLKRGL
jgi:dipeptidyl-peptidase-4